MAPESPIDPTVAAAPMAVGRARSRARDWWRWVNILPALGGLVASGALFAKRRPGWACLILLSTLASIVLFGVGGAKIHDSDYSSTNFGFGVGGYGSYREYHQGQELAGIGALLWWLTIALGWCVPHRTAGAFRRPWPEVSDRAKALSARYGLVAYVIAFGAVVALNYILKAAGAHLGIGPGVLVVDAILLAGLAPLVLRGKLGARDLGLRGTKAGAGAGLAILAFCAYIALAAVYSLLFIHASSSTGTVTRNYNISAGPSTFTVYLDCFAMAIAAPVTEEIFFRGLLYRSLRNRMPIWAAALIAGALFGLVHITGYPLITIPIKMLFGVLMCLLYERTRSLLPTIAVHAVVDGSAADFIFTGNLDIAGIVIGAALLAVLLRVIYNAIADRGSVTPQPSEPPLLTAPPLPAPTPYTQGRMPW